MNEPFAGNAAMIEREIAWFRQIVESRFEMHGGKTPERDLLSHIKPPKLPDCEAPYADVIRKFGMGPAERLALILAYAPHVRPEILDPFLIQNQSVQRRFTEFGG